MESKNVRVGNGFPQKQCGLCDLASVGVVNVKKEASQDRIHGLVLGIV
jgi:hypothetical protein